LAQHNTKISRTIRENIHNVILFYQPQIKEARMIAQDYACELPIPVFIKMWNTETHPSDDGSKSCLLIEMGQPDLSKKFRLNFLSPIDFKRYMSSDETFEWDQQHTNV
jgi:hypothetical protein